MKNDRILSAFASQINKQYFRHTNCKLAGKHCMISVGEPTRDHRFKLFGRREGPVARVSVQGGNPGRAAGAKSMPISMYGDEVRKQSCACFIRNIGMHVASVLTDAVAANSRTSLMDTARRLARRQRCSHAVRTETLSDVMSIDLADQIINF